MALTTVAAVAFPAPSPGQPPSAPTKQPGQPVVVEVSEGGFRWGDAAIGAVAASGVAVALTGLSMVRRQLQKEEQ